MDETKVNIDKSTSELLYLDNKGFVKFKLCRSSDFEKLENETDELQKEQIYEIQDTHWREFEDEKYQDDYQKEKDYKMKTY